MNTSGKAAFIKGNASNYADAIVAAVGKKTVLGRLIKDVVNDLHDINEPGCKRLQGICGLMIVDGKTNCAYFAGSPHFLNGLEPLVVVRPFVVPDMELIKKACLTAGLFSVD